MNLMRQIKRTLQEGVFIYMKRRTFLLIVFLGISVLTVGGCRQNRASSDSGRQVQLQEEAAEDKETVTDKETIPDEETVTGVDGQAQENKEIFRTAVNKGNDTLWYSTKGGFDVTDTFFVSGDLLFLDNGISEDGMGDGVSDRRIFVYRDGALERRIPIPWNIDVKLLYYDAQGQALKAVYETVGDNGAVHTCLGGIDMETGEVTKQEELKDILGYAFDTSGNLLANYLGERENETVLVEEYEKKNAQEEPVEGRRTLAGTDGAHTVNMYCERQEDDRRLSEYITIENEGTAQAYAIPEGAQPLQCGSVQMAGDGTVYQMDVSEDGVVIYQLAQKPFAQFEESACRVEYIQ